MDWTIIQQALPAYGHGFTLTVGLSIIGIIGSSYSRGHRKFVAVLQDAGFESNCNSLCRISS